MSNGDQSNKTPLPTWHLIESYPDAKTIFSITTPSLEEVRDKANFVLDTNVLLLPYRTTPKTLEDIKRTYQQLISENRLFIPAQVAREFAKNRPNRIGEIYQEFSKKRDEQKNWAVNKYSLLESLPDYKQLLGLETEISKKMDEYRKTLGSILEHIEKWQWNDPVSMLYRELFVPEIIIDFSIDRNKVEEDLKQRIQYRIPPGYKDSGKDDGGIGDVAIWHTILELGAKRKQPLIFVTGEEKSDWWHKSNKIELYPRFELVDEYRRQSGGQPFLIAKFSQLLNIFGVVKEVVEEIKEEERELAVTDSSHTISNVFVEAAHSAFRDFLLKTFPHSFLLKQSHFPNYQVLLNHGPRLGADLYAGSLSYMELNTILVKVLWEANEAMQSGIFDLFLICLIAEDRNHTYEYISPMLFRDLNKNIGVFIGYLRGDQLEFTYKHNPNFHKNLHL